MAEIESELWDRADRLEKSDVVQAAWGRAESVREQNQLRVIRLLQEQALSEVDLAGTTGYGYDDRGREALEAIYAAVFGGEAALVRPQIASGTHALAACLFGLLRPGDKLLAVAGKPYDTLETVIGVRGNAPGTLVELGIDYAEVPLTQDGQCDLPAVKSALRDRAIRVALLQRSRGYSWRSSIDVESLGGIIAAVKEERPDVICLVDNCYGEFTEAKEPGHVGADVIAGSLIKNPGGGLAPYGGYVVGRESLVERVAARLIAPGIGREVGATAGWLRQAVQGLFLAPHVTAEALKGAVFGAAWFESLGFAVSPLPGGGRTDIIQAVRLGSAERLVAFCRGIQEAAILDAMASPQPAPMPGYTEKVVMAAGGFVHGSSIELSADGPLREPYVVYLQGGLVYEQIKLAVLLASDEIFRVGEQ